MSGKSRRTFPAPQEAPVSRTGNGNADVTAILAQRRAMDSGCHADFRGPIRAQRVHRGIWLQSRWHLHRAGFPPNTWSGGKLKILIDMPPLLGLLSEIPRSRGVTKWPITTFREVWICWFSRRLPKEANCMDTELC